MSSPHARLPFASVALITTLGWACHWAVLAAEADNQPKIEATSPPKADDPWATTRGCTKVIDKFIACAQNPAFKKLLATWTAPASGTKLTDKRLQARLAAWKKTDGRRRQCAIWAGREGTAENIGETAPVGKILANPRSSCDEFGRELDKTRWLPAAMAQDPPSNRG